MGDFYLKCLQYVKAASPSTVVRYNQIIVDPARNEIVTWNVPGVPQPADATVRAVTVTDSFTLPPTELRTAMGDVQDRVTALETTVASLTARIAALEARP
jgi:hypothetical protein